ncbi:unnamed protein product [Mytilus coruscus]|uniref:C2H2-type domain-containing protein n=1 Tax=Mytilus coruscus TaxID=42192 RepID=A0A6J8D005_MYTCO|nr:unnamed protein product [Mytilus coruscus]
MLASYILKQNKIDNKKGDDPEIDLEKGSSPAKATNGPAQSPEKRLVSILNYKGKGLNLNLKSTEPSTSTPKNSDAKQTQTKNDGDKRTFIEGLDLQQSSEKSKRVMAPKRRYTKKPKITDADGLEKGKKSSSTSQNSHDSENDGDNKGNNSSDVGNFTSVISLGDTITLTRCKDSDCGCNAVHCPFCVPSHYKPSKTTKIRDHLELNHFVHAVQYEDMLILKCSLNCESRTETHYHCPMCKNVTVLKKGAFFRHLFSHARKAGKPPTVIRIPDTKHPSSIIVSGYAIQLCKKKCGPEVASPHFHCPICESLHPDRKSVIFHLWRCEESSQKDETIRYGPSDDAIDKAYKTNQDLLPVSENEEIKGHVSIVRSLQDLPLEKCQDESCCKGKRIHCALCTIDRIKPCFLKKIKIHNHSHWSRRIPYKGYFILPCYLDCQLRDISKSITRIVPHFHCPVCGGNRRRRNSFIHHLEICQGEGMPVAKLPLNIPVDDGSKLNLKLEEVDAAIDEEIEDSLFVATEDNDTGIDDSETISQQEPKEANPKGFKIFSNITAEISDELMSAVRSKGLEDKVFEEVSELTNVSYMVAPGIVSPVHSFVGDMEAITNAMLMVKKRLGMKDNERTCTRADMTIENEDDSFGLEDSNFDNGLDESQESVGSIRETRQGKKRRLEMNQSEDPLAKKIKQEPIDLEFSPEKTSLQENSVTPGRRYSTRGVRVDFAKLAASGKRQVLARKDNTGDVTPAVGAKSADKHSTEEEEIVLINEKNERVNVKLPKGIAAKIKQKIAAVESVPKGKLQFSMEEPEFSDTEEFLTDNHTGPVTRENVDFRDSKGNPVTSGCLQYQVQKYKLSTSAFIPKINIDIISNRKNNRKCFTASDRLYRCSKCEFVCDKFTDCSEHLTREHPLSAFRCDVCERHFDQERYLKIHLDSKHGPFLEAEQYNCEFCGKVYQNMHMLQTHVDTKHTNPHRKKHACRHCDYIGEDRPDLESHVKSNHFKEANACPTCGKYFRGPVFLKQHIENVHQRTNEVKCYICGRLFANSRYLKLHMEVHVGEKKHACSVCGQRFRKRGNMISHEQTHLNKEDRTYRYVCNFCGMKVNSRANLLQHMNKHTGEKPYLCDICGKSFAYTGAVAKHKVFCHSSEYPHECRLCDKKFKLERLLKEHMTTHTGIGEHECDGCKKVFTTSTTLKNHKPKCKGLRVQLGPDKVVIFSSPKISNMNSYTLLPGGMKIDIDKSNEQNHIPTQTVIMESTVYNQPLDEMPTEVHNLESQVESGSHDQVETAAQEPSTDVAVYMCSECNAAFSDFALAEQHVLMGHDTAAPNQTIPDNVQTDNVTAEDAVNFILSGVNGSQ